MTSTVDEFRGLLPADLATLRDLVLADSELCGRLKAHDAEAFVADVVRAGQERGLLIEAEDVDRALRVARRAWIERRIP